MYFFWKNFEIAIYKLYHNFYWFGPLDIKLSCVACELKFNTPDIYNTMAVG